MVLLQDYPILAGRKSCWHQADRIGLKKIQHKRHDREADRVGWKKIQHKGHDREDVMLE
jgi:hypothetical protein